MAALLDSVVVLVDAVDRMALQDLVLPTDRPDLVAHAMVVNVTNGKPVVVMAIEADNVAAEVDARIQSHKSQDN